MRKLDQNGSGVVEVILILVVIAILGFAGWFVWHSRQTRLPDKTTGTSSTLKTSGQEPTAGNTTTVAPASVNITLTSPAGWEVTHPGDYTTDITGPGGDVYIEVSGLAGLGGMCQPDQQGMYRTVQTVQLNNPSLTLVAYTSDDQYQGPVASEVVPTSDASHFKVGSSVCDGYLNQVLGNDFLGKSTAKDVNVVGTSIIIGSKSILSTKQSGKTPSNQAVQAFLSSDDYKTAVSIIKTLQY